MLIKVNYDASTGEIKGFFPDDTPYSSIPEPYIEVDEDTWLDCRNNQGQRIVDVTNKVIITGTITVTLTTDEKVAALEAEYKAKINELAQEYSGALLADKLYGTSNADSVYADFEAVVTEYTTALEAIE